MVANSQAEADAWLVELFKDEPIEHKTPVRNIIKKVRCERCMGSGKVSFRPANGMCYRCNGSGEVAI